ncbi:23S rRNA (uracil-5-)-methyltransferase RumA, partial [Alkalihalophilus pseudofirmus]|nr:23S rRNA (uracil-5-)-methyltransferase RumA [Alkalihalophilus pseudofirmus]
YVSCNPSTLAKDIQSLSSKFNVNYIQPVDMFPQTAHVECVVLMSRVEK